MVPLSRNESKGGHCQPFFWYIFVARSKGCGVHPNLKLWAQNESKNEKMKINKFYPGSRGEQGGRKKRFALQCNFCVCKANLLLTPPFFHFGINISFVIAKEEFQKNFYYSGIKLIVQKQIWKILLIRFLFFFVFLEYRTRDWAKNLNQIAGHLILSLGF